MDKAQNAKEKWKEMRLKVLRGIAVPRKAFPLYSPVQAETPQYVWGEVPFTFTRIALYRKWRTNEKKQHWRLLQESKLEPSWWNGLTRCLAPRLDRAGDEWICGAGDGKEREESRMTPGFPA